MKYSEIEEQAKTEVIAEDTDEAKAALKVRIREIAAARKALAELERQYAELLAQDIED